LLHCQALTAEIQNEGGKLTERQAVQKVAQPCLTALADLHAKGIAHGALLPHNILFNSQEIACKLAGERFISMCCMDTLQAIAGALSLPCAVKQCLQCVLHMLHIDVVQCKHSTLRPHMPMVVIFLS